MICKHCGAEVSEGAKFCNICGAAVEAAYVPPQPVNSQPQQVYVQPQPVYVQSQPAYASSNPGEEYNNGYNAGYQKGLHTVPPEYMPPSPWAYFGLTLLYSVPVLGFIFLIIHSANRSNLARRNFALSFWIPYAIAAIAAVIFVILLLVGAITMQNFSGS